MIYGFCRMIYLQSEYDIISVPFICVSVYPLRNKYHTRRVYRPLPQGTDIIESL